MLFLTIVTRVVYWYMDHNNPAKFVKKETKIKETKRCKKTVRIVEPEKEAAVFQTTTEKTIALIEEPKVNAIESEVRKASEFKCTGCTDEDINRRHCWEKNEIDYMGRDSFDNILAKLNQSLAG
ncbi:uncharacterized protein [Argopecten irradians]|uniref:uncharacterized protein n=1 Tax=Argopecten irradians TaxID=31199 RepID=UPI00371726BF